jgi:murein DD-endopeptidase MepM/ murein hydrolase activator NlpD
MEEYNDSALGFEASESRFEQVRALREQRSAQRKPARHAHDKAMSNAQWADGNPYADVPPYENYELNHDEPPRGSLARVVVTQTVVCAVLLGGLLLCQKTMPHIYRQLQTAYTQAMRTDMSAKEVWTAAVHAFRNLKEDVYVMAPYRQPTADSAEPTTQQPAERSAAPTQSANATTTGEAPTTRPRGEVGAPDGIGGMDVTLAYAERHCSWVPLQATVQPYMPVEGHMSSPFGYRVDPINSEETVHTGIDIAAQEGTPIHAAFYGTVAEVGTGKDYGNYVIMDHAGGLRTLYAHCSELLAAEGMVLRAGDVLALVGSTGRSTGPHVHFEMRLHNIRCNPAEVLGLVVQEAAPSQ